MSHHSRAIVAGIIYLFLASTLYFAIAVAFCKQKKLTNPSDTKIFEHILPNLHPTL